MLIFAHLCLYTMRNDIKNRDLYFVSPFDPLNFNKKEEKGFFEHHKIPTIRDTFGDVSVITFNAISSSVLIEQDSKTVKAILTLLDENHPTFLTLQSVNNNVLRELKAYFDSNSHYHMTLTDQPDTDLITGANYYLPIIYDINLIRCKNEGYFRTEEKPSHIYASYLQVTDTRLANSSTYTIINVDLYSTFNDITNAEFFNIVSDVRECDVKDNPVFICGTINTLPNNVKTEIEISFENVLDKDTNNAMLKRSTINKRGVEIGQEKEYILLRDFYQKMIINYARILSDFTMGERFPVYSILSFRTSKDKNSEMKLFDIIPPKNDIKEEYIR